MQCVIICAGKGTRMRPLTDTIAKPLINICGKPILQHIVEPVRHVPATANSESIVSCVGLFHFDRSAGRCE